MSDADATSLQVQVARKRDYLRLVWKWLAPFIGLFVVLAFFHMKSDRFLDPLNMKVVAAQTVIVGVCALGMTFIMIGGGIDLSVGSVIALCSVFLALSYQQGWPTWAGILVTVGVGGLCGLVNGVLITGLQIIPFVATLGMMSIARGAARYFADNSIVRLTSEHRPDQLAEFVQPIQSMAWWDLAPSVWVMVGMAVLCGIVLNLTTFGRRVYALGSNELASRYSGVRINRQKLAIYTVGGLLTGLAGVFVFANTVQGDPSAGVGLELQVIAAVVIGGGSLAGGEGSVLGTLIGAFMLTALVNGCTMAEYPNYVQEIVIGAIIVLAVALDHVRKNPLSVLRYFRRG